MKRIISAVAAGLITLAGANYANAFDIKDLLGSKSGMLGNLIEGVFMKSDLDIKDLTGVWTSSGSAVNFADENLLMKAGGLAAASALETKIDPYFQQYGLVGSTLTINPDSTFNLKAKKLNLSGTVTKDANGDFLFKMKAFGRLTLGEIPAHVQKTSTSMNVMFDSTKIKKVLNLASKLLNMKSVDAVMKIVDQYDGIYIGCKLTKTGDVEQPSSETTDSKDKKTGLLESILGGSRQKTDTTSGEKKSGGLLESILGGNKNTTTKPDTTTNKSSSTDNKKSGGDLLKDILKGLGNKK